MPSNIVKISIKNQPQTSYSIIIQEGLLEKIPEILQKETFGNRYAIIADQNVAKLYGKKLQNILQKKNIESILITFPAGEKNKTLQTAEKLMNALLKKNWGRKDAILALGGGVTGDLAGFVASIYKRGIPFAHIPTTLLAMVDSSIGGKTGVNLAGGKNLCGTFYQPQKIFIDPGILKTLPKQEFLNGFAEIIKSSIIAKKELFLEVEKIIRENKIFDTAILYALIIQTAKIKASIIEKDEKENGVRMWLNYGHTIGHAIEKLTNYKIPHGLAVILGMILINKISEKLDILNKKDEKRINNLLNALVTPFIKPSFFKDLDPQKIWAIMLNDKKMQNGQMNFIMPLTIGKVMICDKITKKIFLKYFPKM